MSPPPALYVWIHCANRADDILVPFLFSKDAHSFARVFIDDLPDHLYHYDINMGQMLIGSSPSVQVIILKADSEPKEGWGFWAPDYSEMAANDVLTLSRNGAFL